MRILSGIQPYDASALPRLIEGMLVSLLAAGLDPRRCRIFLQFKDKAVDEAAGAIAGATMAEVRFAMGLWQASTTITAS